MQINEVSKMFNLSISTLRYYEEIGLINEVKKVNGKREYQEEDIERINFIVCMKKSGMPLSTMHKYFSLYNQGDSTLDERLDILLNEKNIALQKIKDIEDSVEYLNFKINLTKEKISKKCE